MKKGDILTGSILVPLNTSQRTPADPKLKELLEKYGWLEDKDGERLIPQGFYVWVADVNGKLCFILVNHPSVRRFIEITILGDPQKDYTQMIWRE